MWVDEISVCLVFSEGMERFRLVKPSAELASLVILMWPDQERLSMMVMPRYGCSDTVSRVEPATL